MSEKIGELKINKFAIFTDNGATFIKKNVEYMLRQMYLYGRTSALDEVEKGLHEEIAIPATTYDQEEFQAKLEYQGFNTCLKETKQLISRLRSETSG